MLVKESLEKQLRTSLVPASETCGEDKYQKINAYANPFHFSVQLKQASHTLLKEKKV